MAIAESLLTVEEYTALPDPGQRTELVRGRIVAVPPPGFEHGKICVEMIFSLTLVVKGQGSGQVVGNDSGVLTQRDPDSLRGADVAYYGPAKAQRIGRTQGYPESPPDLVVEVRSPSDRWREVLAKVLEYLSVGVPIVVVLDPDTRSAHLFEGDQPPRKLGPEDTLTFPDLLGDFAVVVERIFA